MSQNYDVADCLAKVRLHINRPSTDAALPDSTLYVFMQEGQERAQQDLALRAVDKMRGDPVLLTSSDGGYTFGFSTDAGLPTNYTANTPITHVEIYPSLTAIPDSPLVEGIDYIGEGTLIRMLGHRVRSFPNGPYARFLVPAGTVDGSTGVLTLKPVFARILIVWHACSCAARRIKQDTTEWEVRYARDLKRILLVLRNQYDSEGMGAGDGNSGGDWTKSSDMTAY